MSNKKTNAKDKVVPFKNSKGQKSVPQVLSSMEHVPPGIINQMSLLFVVLLVIMLFGIITSIMFRSPLYLLLIPIALIVFVLFLAIYILPFVSGKVATLNASIIQKPETIGKTRKILKSESIYATAGKKIYKIKVSSIKEDYTVGAKITVYYIKDKDETVKNGFYIIRKPIYMTITQ